MNKQEILRKHLGQTEAEFQDLGKKNTLDAMEEYAELYQESKVETLGLFSVVQQRELLIDLLKWVDDGYNMGETAERIVDDYIKEKGNL